MRRPGRQEIFYRKENSLEQQLAHNKMLEKARALSKEKKSDDMPTLDDSPPKTGMKQ